MREYVIALTSRGGETGFFRTTGGNSDGECVSDISRATTYYSYKSAKFVADNLFRHNPWELPEGYAEVVEL